VPTLKLAARYRCYLSYGVVAVVSTLLVFAPTSGSSAEVGDAPTRRVSISGSGDLLVHTPLWQTARTKKSFDFADQLTPLRPILNADVNLCHLETPLTKGEPRGYPVFATPIELASGIAKAGWQGCSLASNHTFDLGQLGVALTRSALLRQGVLPSGVRISKTDPPFAVHTVDNGLRVAHLSYTYGTNGIPAPDGKDWLVNLIDVPRILADAQAAKKIADVVVVAMHWGSEYQEAPNASQRRIATRLLKSPHIDGLIGHHVHVMQPADLVNGKPVVFGHGNLWSGQGPWSNHSGGQRGVVTSLEFEVDQEGKVKFVGGEYAPTLVDPRDWSVYPATDISAGVWDEAACTAIKETARLYGSVLKPNAKTSLHKCHPR
jgi:hypothetical protein